MKSIIITSVFNRMCRLRTLLPVAFCGIYALFFISCASFYVSSPEAHNRIIPWTKLPEKESGTEQGIAAFAQVATSDILLQALFKDAYDSSFLYADYLVLGGASTWFNKKFNANAGWSTHLAASGFYSQVVIDDSLLIVNEPAWGMTVQADAMLHGLSNTFGTLKWSLGGTLLWSLERGNWYDTRTTMPNLYEQDASVYQVSSTGTASDYQYNMCPSGQSLSGGIVAELVQILENSYEWGYGLGIHYTLHDATMIGPLLMNSLDPTESYRTAVQLGMYSTSHYLLIRTKRAQYWIQSSIPFNMMIFGNANKYSVSFGTLFKL